MQSSKRNLLSLSSLFALSGLSAVTTTAQTPDFSFSAPRAYSAVAGTDVLATGDFNGDRRDDLAAGGNASYIAVLLNIGKGVFAPAVDYPLPGFPSDAKVGDFNGDNIPDLAVTTSVGISILLGNGDGTFQPAITTAGSAGALAVGDFNHDGKLDIATAAGNVNIYLGNGDGTFQLSASLNVETGVNAIVAADFNRDGTLDLAVSGGDEVIVLQGLGGGSFGGLHEYVTGANTVMLTAGDVNRDGKLDIVALVTDGYSVLLGNGKGSFQQAVNYGGLSSPVSAVLRDFNSDGIPDLVSVTRYPGYLFYLEFDVQVLLGNGDGTFGAPKSFSAGSGASGGVDAIITGAFTASGNTDIAVANVGATFEGGVYVLMGDGKGGFTEPLHFGNEGSGVAAVGDFNHDGNLDVAQYNGVDVSLFLGDGKLQLQKGQSYDVTDGAYYPLMTAADVNRDGALDLILSAGGPDTTINVLLGNGDGTFQPPLTQSIGNGSPWAVAVGDLNGDAIPDIVFAVSDSEDVWVMLGNGDGTFAPAVLYSAGHLPGGVAIADFNGDGKLDIAAADVGGNGGFAILLGNGDGTFAPALTFPGFGYASVYAADVNGDRILDLVLGSINGVVGVALGKGDGTFRQQVEYTVGSDAYQLAVGDFNGDGTIDIAAVDSLANDVHMLSGDGNGAFVVEPFSFQTTGAPRAIVTGDMTNDGKLDLIVSVVPAFDLLYNSAK